MIATASSAFLVVLLVTNVQGQSQPMLNSSCRSNERLVGYCSNGYCFTPGAYCTSGRICCVSNYPIYPPAPSAGCPVGQAELGPCVNFGCQSGAQCINSRCCANGVSQSCPVGRTELGPCINLMCQSGAQCINSKCCANGASQSCPTNFNNIGPCIAGTQCPPPAICQNGMCCSSIGRK